MANVNTHNSSDIQYKRSEIQIHFFDEMIYENQTVKLEIRDDGGSTLVEDFTLISTYDTDLSDGRFTARNNRTEITKTQTQLFADGFNYNYPGTDYNIETSYDGINDVFTIKHATEEGLLWEYNGDNLDAYLDIDIYYYEEDDDPIEIDEDDITVSKADSNVQENVKYEFSTEVASYPYEITSPIEKTVEDTDDEWIEYNRYPNKPDQTRDNLIVESSSGDVDSVELPLVGLFEFHEINVNETSTDATIEIIAHFEFSGDINPSLQFSIDGNTYQDSDSGDDLKSTFNVSEEGTYTAYIKDEYGREVTQDFTVTFIDYNIKFKIRGDKIPFKIDLYECNNLLKPIGSTTLASSGSTGTFNDVESGMEYMLVVTDSVGNVSKYTKINVE